MDLEKLRKLTLSSGFTFKELLMMQRTFKNLDDDERRYLIENYTKSDNIYNVILLFAGEVGFPVLYITAWYIVFILIELYDNAWFMVPFTSLIYVIVTMTCLCYKRFCQNYPFPLCIKLTIFYTRLKIKEKFKQL
ncbi:hypothetical protein EAE91_06565 [Photorhabdus noenieputensis]|uniref:Uncharacterized protein n=1 Tax=Photorhabdus australis subsp. thailandensis TaxID=2805096 RepID=A0A1C0U3Y6_9GAMM|nr:MULTISPECIES: hypothetical protein [Photorhabdus]MBS9436852.1 hypothetical protein [Photorhabdus noenieputensis]MCK3671563.1 hypothetical protein [Photorhabdus noenieputensis]NRN30899.1 hypothetical protein [Photorhabdus heterorhabditis subsp. aluminescens]OCQ52644.1 hypothetical protein Ppb6_01987 [Photorhabdus australis subsp. thailandensis]